MNNIRIQTNRNAGKRNPTSSQEVNHTPELRDLFSAIYILLLKLNDVKTLVSHKNPIYHKPSLFESLTALFSSLPADNAE
jgi:hypothetical protein